MGEEPVLTLYKVTKKEGRTTWTWRFTWLDKVDN